MPIRWPRCTTEWICGSTFEAIAPILLKTLTWLACLYPLARLLWGAVTNNLGADPTHTIAFATGLATIRLLVLYAAEHRKINGVIIVRTRCERPIQDDLRRRDTRSAEGISRR